MMPLLDARNLILHFKTRRGNVRAVDNISLSLERGRALGVVGESGCGKTSLALAIMRLLPANVQTYSGSVFFDGTDLMELPNKDFSKRIRWRRISMVFQGAMNSLNPVLTVGFQVIEPKLLEGSINREEARREAISLLRMVGLSEDVFNRYPHELSGGMKQRAIIAMSLILNPQMVVMDESTSALDVSVQAQIMNLLKRLKGERGLSILFITHDIALASDICDSLTVMYAGEIIEWGSAEQILLTPSHPYTKMLLASTPRLRGDATPSFIPGAPPDLVEPPLGCRFHPRCPYAFEPCKEESPLAFRVGEGHLMRCWLYREGVEI